MKFKKSTIISITFAITILRLLERLKNSTGPNGCNNIVQERDSGVTPVCKIIKCICGKECRGV